MNQYSILGAGFIGNYLAQHLPATVYGRSQRADFSGQEHDIVVVCAPTGNRVRVNQSPALDLQDCNLVFDIVKNARYNHVIYISTVDTYADQQSCNDQPGKIQPQSAYGSNRWYLEHCISTLPNVHVIRLCSLVDASIQKNILYDLKNRRWLNGINLESTIQWYPLCRLPNDLKTCIQLPYTNLVSPPIKNRDIVSYFTPELLSQLQDNTAPLFKYNIKSDLQTYTVSFGEIWQSFREYFSCDLPNNVV